MFFKTQILGLIISDNKDYESLLNNNVYSQDTVFETIRCPSENQLNKAAVILYDHPLIKDNVKRHALMIGMMEQDQVQSIDRYSNFDDIWILPMNSSLFQFRSKKLVELAIEKKKSEIQDIYLNTMMNSVPDLIWFKDLRGAHLKVNDAFGKAVGKSKEQCEGRGHYYIWDLKPDEYADGEYVCLETEEEVIRRGETCLFDEKVKGKNGLRQFKTYKSPLYDYFGTMIGTVGVAKDVTDLHNISRELEVVLSSVPFASLIVDEHDNLVYANRVFYQIFNLDIKGDEPLNYQKFCKTILHLDETKWDDNKEVIVTLNDAGDIKHLNVQQQSIKDIFGNHFGYFLICIDITREKELQDEILHNANTDFLTGLYNRRYFYKKVHNLSTYKKVAFVYFDLDCFKVINDTYGHQVGDEALKLMSTLLQKEFYNDLIVRLGGDEFLIAISLQEDVNEIIPKIENFIEYTKSEFQKSKILNVLSLSAGISCGDHNFETDQLLLEADSALYKAKSLGKGIACVYNCMDIK